MLGDSLLLSLLKQVFVFCWALFAAKDAHDFIFDRFADLTSTLPLFRAFFSQLTSYWIGSRSVQMYIGKDSLSLAFPYQDTCGWFIIIIIRKLGFLFFIFVDRIWINLLFFCCVKIVNVYCHVLYSSIIPTFLGSFFLKSYHQLFSLRIQTTKRVCF